MKTGENCIISDEAEIAEDVIIWHNVKIFGKVKIGKGTVIMNDVEIRDNTEIGDNCYIDSGCRFSGECFIGNNVTLRYETIIARGCSIGDGCYICPRVMFNNLDTKKKKIGGAKLGMNVFVATHSVIHHGVVIESEAEIGAQSFVNRDIEIGVWGGTPVRKLKLKKPLK